jgi:hypothetical protein
MGKRKCDTCGCDILELDSHRCIGHACERRLCIPCHSESFGLCRRHKIHQEIEADRIQGKYDGSDEEWNKYWEGFEE